MLRDNVGITQTQNLDKVPIPVDRHVARATLALGVVRGEYKGSLDRVFQIIRRAWSESVEGLSINGRPMIALDVDEPLWHLSKYGCSERDKVNGSCPLINVCEAKDFCIPGVINITKIKWS
jgi:endonuclease III